jgi:hypothetical protein
MGLTDGLIKRDEPLKNRRAAKRKLAKISISNVFYYPKF